MFILGLGRCSFKEGGVAFSSYGLGAGFQDQQRGSLREKWETGEWGLSLSLLAGSRGWTMRILDRGATGKNTGSRQPVGMKVRGPQSPQGRLLGCYEVSLDDWWGTRGKMGPGSSAAQSSRSENSGMRGRWFGCKSSEGNEAPPNPL